MIILNDIHISVVSTYKLQWVNSYDNLKWQTYFIDIQIKVSLGKQLS